MTWQATPYTFLMIVSAMAGLYLSVYALRHREVAGINSFVLLTLAIVILSIGKLGELMGNDLTTKLISGKILVTGIVISSLSWLMLGVQQTYRYHRTLRTLWITGSALIFLDLAIIWSNDVYHQLFWEKAFIKEAGDFRILSTVRGPLHLFHTGTMYLMVLCGSVLMLARSFGDAKLYLKQRVALLLTVTMPLGANLYFLLDIGGGSLDYTPFGYAAGCIFLAYGYFRLHMVDSIPLAMDYVIEHLPDPVIIVDPHNRIQVLNEKARALLGDSEKRFSGEIMTDVLPPGSPYIALSELETDSSLLIKDGDRTYDARSRPVPGNDEQILGRMFMLQDISQRLSAEEAHQENLRIFRQFAEALPIAFYELDEAGNVAFGNSEMQNLFGYSDNDLKKLNLHQLFKRQDAIKPYKKRNPDTDNAEIELEELTALNNNGKEFSVINLIANIVDEKFLVGRRGVVIDITERKKMEEASRLSVIAAEQASQVKSQFLANMSHEIRTPMNGVIGFAQLLTSTRLDKNQKRYVDLILKSGRGLLQVINDILDLSRIEAGKLELEITAFDPAKTISDVTSVFEQTAANKDIEFSCTISKNLPSSILGDAARISQILNNVIGNAVKFTEKGKVSVTANCIISGNRSNPNGVHKIVLAIEIADTGIGIEEDHIDRLFDPFAQLDGTITRRFGGTGLGLAITSDLLKAMDGYIKVDSKPGEGSKFHITIPLEVDFTDARIDMSTGVQNKGANANVNVNANVNANANIVQLDKNQNDSADHKILLVEDNPVNREVAIGFLEKMGYQTEIAVNGSDAVEMASSKEYDLILMDIHMPEMDGLEATSLIRKNGQSIDTPIIGVTADVMAGQKEKCLAAGMTDHLAKPIVFKSLKEMVDKYLSL